MSRQQIRSLIIIWAGLHHRSLTRTASPPPFRLPLVEQSLSALTVWKPSIDALLSWISLWSHDSVKHIRLHYWYSLWLRASAVNSSSLLARERTFPIIIAGRHGLNLLLSLSLCCLTIYLFLLLCAPPLHSRCVFLQISSGISTSLAINPAGLRAISWSPL